MRRVVLAAATGLAAAAAMVVPAHAAPTITGLEYVAMGDSYSAASGVLPSQIPSNLWELQCTRSMLNYASDIARDTGAKLTDVSCGAAETKDFAGSQFNGVAPQLDALSASTRLVTMTIGGNDSSVFLNTILNCGTEGISHLGLGHPCQDKYGTSFVDTINNVTYPALVAALTAVHQKAPNARVAILGYPLIMPPSGGCFLQMPVASGDVPYVYNIQKALNAAIGRAAAATGTIYVNMDAASAGHDACQPIGTRWIEPVLLGTNPVVVHPNAQGEAAMAARAEAVLHLL